MQVTLTHRSGAMSEYRTESDLDALLAELDEAADPEHPDVAVSVESGWTISAFPSGLVVWENPEDESEPRHRRELSRQDTRKLLLMLASNMVDEIERIEWLDGHGN
jgi:hypothetical protein